MATARSEFQLHISNTVDLAAIEKAKQAYSDLSAQLKALQSDIEFAQRAGIAVPPEAQAQVDKLTKAIAAYGQTVSKTEVTHKELHEGLRLVAITAGDALGPIGELAHFLGNPYILAASGAVLAIKLVAEGQSALHDAMVKNIEASRDQATMFRENHIAALNEAAAAANQFQIQMDHLRDSINQTTQALQVNLTSLQENRTETENLLTAEENLIRARIQGGVASGALTSVEGAALQQRLERDARTRREAIEDQEKQGEIDAKYTAIHKDRQDISDAQTRLTTEVPDQTRLNELIKNGQGMLASGKRALPTMDSAASEAQININNLQKELQNAHGIHEIGPSGQRVDVSEAEERAQIQAGIEAQQKIVDAAKREHDYLERKLPEQIAAWERQKGQIDANVEADKKLVEAKNLEIDTLHASITELKRTLQAHQAARAQLDALADQTNQQERLNYLTERGARGQLTPDEQAEFHGASVSNPTALINATRTRVAGIVHDVHVNGGHVSAEEFAQLGELMDTLIGLAENTHYANQSQHTAAASAIAGLRSQVEGLRRTVEQHTDSLHSGPYQ